MLVDKPAGATSRYVVEGVRRSLGAARAGHAGTLDPAATGLLVVLLEEATKLSAWAMGFDKAYQAEVHFGVSTDTLDRDGQVVERVDVPAGTLTEARIEAALAGLVGAAEQVPPIYAAIKREGRSLMSRARAGEDVVAEPRAVVCHGLELLGWDPPVARLHVRCGKGYYVRSLARDLGAALGLPAHLSALRRTAVGAWRIEDAVPPEAVAPSHLLAIHREGGQRVVGHDGWCRGLPLVVDLGVGEHLVQGDGLHRTPAGHDAGELQQALELVVKTQAGLLEQRQGLRRLGWEVQALLLEHGGQLDDRAH